MMMANAICQVECEFLGECTLKELLVEMLVCELHMFDGRVNAI